MMYVKELHIRNMRGLKDVELTFKPGVNLLVGPNSVGKSTVLDALRIMLSALTSRVVGEHRKTKRFTNRDIRQGFELPALRVDVHLELNNQLHKWHVEAFRSSGGEAVNQASDYSAFNQLNLLKLKKENLSKAMLWLQDNSLPLALYYSVNRALKTDSIKPQLSVTKIHLDELSAFENALEPTGVDFAQLERWFAYRYKFIKKQFPEKLPLVDDLQLKAVEAAVAAFLPELANLHYCENEKGLVVDKHGERFNVNQLSDGELSLLALVADIARRLAIANSFNFQPLTQPALVMVDEIDLHLHPAWQRKIVGLFESTFPNVQFIFTTHSPQILSHVKPESIWLFQRNEAGEVEPYQPDTSFGMDSSSILRLLFDVSEREETTEQQLKQLVQFVDQNQLEEGKKLIVELQSQCGDIDLLQRMKAVIWRKELLAGRDVKD
ncbi:AAA family ATPase [Rheinheimera sp. MM224]|uniref:AAA family ATPase n=1 Tax=Rheinheimera sp. MM224 TaxID=3019969 RepID=UPI0021F82D0D|nr:AAA family ATPase [Rheinheimera sp. MM224]CAI3798174.1 DNA replication and repair protein RecF [Rheinheimera sp. MM224]